MCRAGGVEDVRGKCVKTVAEVSQEKRPGLYERKM
jgi:hypothetical protein